MKNWCLDHPTRPPETGDPKPMARFLSQALTDLGRQPSNILDFGCGSGGLVRSLGSLGFDAWGCDIQAYWENCDNLRVVTLEPAFQLPFPDESFDSVISTSVLEHAQNKDEIFREIYRVLRHGGQMLHLFPGKFYLPVEPHIHVPFVSWLWPHVPRAWLALWAVAGVRTESQGELDWRGVVDANVEFIETGLSYWTHRRLRRSVRSIFGNCQFPNRYNVLHAPGGTARICRRLPFKGITGWASGQFRIGLLYAERH